MRAEQAVITEVSSRGIVVEDDFGDAIHVMNYLIVGTPRVGATCTLVTTHQDRERIRAFVEPEEKPARLSSDPDESGVVLISSQISQLINALG